MRFISFLFGWIIKITGFIPYLFCFRTKVHYEDKSKQNRFIKGKAILMSNHNTVMDAALMLFVFFSRTLRFLAAEILYKKNIFMTFLLKVLGAIKVDRTNNDFSFLNKANKVLDQGGVIEIYPESRIPRKDETKPLEFKPSVVHLALTSNAPIIPVYNQGIYFKGKTNHMIIGTPIFVRDLYDSSLSEKENIANITQKLRQKVIDLQYELESQLESK